MRTIQPRLPAGAAEALFGLTRRRVLAWLLLHPDESFYLRQVARLAGASLGAVQRELRTLSGAGLLQRTVQGRQVYFQADKRSPIYAEMHSLFVKTAGVVDVLRSSLAGLSSRIRAAFVFGSAARGGLRPESDIDLMVVGDAGFGDVVGALVKAQEIIGREVNPTVYPPAEFKSKIRDGHHFLTSVLTEPMVFVIGDAGELERLGAELLADRPQDQLGRNPRSPGRRQTRPHGLRR